MKQKRHQLTELRPSTYALQTGIADQGLEACFSDTSQKVALLDSCR